MKHDHAFSLGTRKMDDAQECEVAVGLKVYDHVMVHMVVPPAAVNCIIAEVRFSDGRFFVSDIRYTSPEGDRPVSGALTSEWTPEMLIFRSLEVHYELNNPGGLANRPKAGAFGIVNSDYLQMLRESGPTTETLRWVAFIYRLALSLGERPTKFVEHVFNGPFEKKLTRATIDRWVSRSRERGFLGPVEGPGKAGEAHA